MSPETLLREFEVMADAPNGVQKLRELILQLAVRGKLVPQDPSDEPASVLLERAKNEKRELIKKKQVRDRKLPSIEEDEVLYEIPVSWTWARIDDVGHELSQKVPDRRFTYIDVSSIENRRGVILPETQILEPGDAPSRARKLVQRGTVIYSTVRPYLLNVTILERDFDPEPIASTAFAVLHPLAGINARYLFYYFRSQPFISYVEAAMTGMAYPAINDGKFYGGAIPLPPLPEQRRIVSKVDELMALCDELEARQQRRTEARARLNRSALHHLTAATDDAEFAAHWQRLQENFHLLYDTPEMVAELRQAVLQLAVRGKLVPQDPDDEPASVLLERIAAEKERLFEEGKIRKPKPLPPVGEDESREHIIPKPWTWVRLGSIVESMDSGWSPACPDHPTSTYHEWGVLKTTAVQRLEYREFEHKALPDTLKPRPQNEVRAGDLLITRAGPKNRVGISCVVVSTRPKLMISDKIIRCHPVGELLYPRFLALCLNAGISAEYVEAKKSGMAESQVNISQTNLAGTPIPLPPLPEQRRIVAKMDELMALCDRLEARLTAAREKGTHLAASVVHHLAAA